MERLFNLDPQLIHDAVLLALAVFVMFTFLSYLLFNPARDFLKKRQDKIKNDLDTAAVDKADARKLKEDYNAKIQNINAEAEEILSQARQKALDNEAKIIAEAKEEAARILSRANAQVELERKAAADDMKKEMIALASLMAEKAVAGAVDAKVKDGREYTERNRGGHMAKVAAKVYGDALFELAVEENRCDQFLEEICAVENALDQNPQAETLICHPGIGSEEKQDFIEKCFKGNVSDDMTGFLQILVKKGRFSERNAIFAYFTAKVKEYKKIGVALVTSPFELTAEQKSKIEKRLLDTTDYKKMEITYREDKTLIGGLVIRIGDRVIDTSIKSRLEELRLQLMGISLEA